MKNLHSHRNCSWPFVAEARSGGKSSVLQRVMGPFHAALGLAAIGAQNLDVELRQSTAELGHAVSAGGILPRYPKDRMLVGIERNRLAIVLQLALHSLGIGKRTLRCDH